MLMGNQSLGQSKDPTSDRFAIVEIDNLHLQDDSLRQATPLPVGDKHNYVLLDTESGETWILSDVWNSTGSSTGPRMIQTAAWSPVYFEASEYQFLKEKLRLSRKPLGK